MFFSFWEAYSWFYPTVDGTVADFTPFINDLEKGMADTLALNSDRVDVTLIPIGNNQISIAYEIYDNNGNLVSSSAFSNLDIKSTVDEQYKYVDDLNVLLGLAGIFLYSNKNTIIFLKKTA